MDDLKEKSSSQRRLFLINPAFQYRFMAWVAGLGVSVVMLMHLSHSWFFYQLRKQALEAGIPADHAFFKFIAVVPIVFRVHRRHYLQPDMKSSMLLLKHFQLSRQSHHIVNQSNFNKRSPQTNISQNHLRDQFSAKYKIIIAGMRPTVIGIHQRQFFHFGVNFLQPAPVDTKRCCACPDMKISKLIHMRKQTDIHIGVYHIVCTTMLPCPK
ncbi:MAG: hypothetical protein EBX52_01915, partial [Proteobacteria bacterium]|nr:hypothetical protein [Pseudomonadota bacterium]